MRQKYSFPPFLSYKLASGCFAGTLREVLLSKRQNDGSSWPSPQTSLFQSKKKAFSFKIYFKKIIIINQKRSRDSRQTSVALSGRTAGPPFGAAGSGDSRWHTFGAKHEFDKNTHEFKKRAADPKGRPDCGTLGLLGNIRDPILDRAPHGTLRDTGDGSLRTEVACWGTGSAQRRAGRVGGAQEAQYKHAQRTSALPSITTKTFSFNMHVAMHRSPENTATAPETFVATAAYECRQGKLRVASSDPQNQPNHQNEHPPTSHHQLQPMGGQALGWGGQQRS